MKIKMKKPDTQWPLPLALASAEKNPEEGITVVAQKNIMGEAPVSNINTKVKYIHSNKTGWKAKINK